MPPGQLILAWNDIYLDVVRRIGGAPGPLARIGGLMHWAMYETINAIAGTPYPSPLGGSLPAPPAGSTLNPGKAAAYAACHTLAKLIDEYVAQTQTPLTGIPNPYGPFQVQPAAHQEVTEILRLATPTQVSVPADAGAAEAAAGASNPDQTYGYAVATAVREAHNATNTNWFDPVPQPPFSGAMPGEWRPTGSGDALTPNWGRVPLLFVGPVSKFEPTVIPGNLRTYDALLKSELYALQLAEVAALGQAHSPVRSEEQTEIAFFWANDLNGTSKPPGQLYTITQVVARQQGTLLDHKATDGKPAADGLLETARLFAAVGTAMLNAGVVAWHSKYFWPGGQVEDVRKLLRLWRPETAIQQATTDNNPSTAAQPAWQPLSATREGMRFSPNFPAFVSGHSTFGAAHAAAMRVFYGTDNVAFTATTEDPHALRDENGVRRTRRFASFTQAALENGRSRVYLGVHYQFDANGGYQIGTSVGEATAEAFMASTPAPTAAT